MRKGVVITLAVILGILSILLGIYFYNQANKEPVVYEVEEPEIRDIVKKAVASGAVRPRKEVMIKPQVSGVVEALYVEPGQEVKLGQQIAKIKLVPSQVNINNARNSLELARIRYNEAQRELERQRGLSDRKLDVDAARLRYEDAKREEERRKALFEDGVVSEQEYNSFRTQMELAKAEYENVQVAATNNLAAFESELNIRLQELEAAENNLQLLQEGASRKSKQVANLVTSTVDGMVLDIPVEVGTSVIERNNFNEGTTIATVADMQSLVFEGQVDESDVGKLREGMPLELTVGAIEGETFDATLEYIAPKGVEEDGSVKFEIKAAIKPVGEIFLRAGYSANADIILDKREATISIKERDLIFEEEATFVEIQTGDQEFEKKPVEIGLSDGIQVEILSGLDTTSQVKKQIAKQ
ncbi:MAG: HlyD family efflux transporter periplasmic adaptor subunit [Bacteroidetes bacterium]|nr:HlyD family efflux transporter periplasmic adaptor subunit [Bacteroidota bacterium]